MGPLAVLGIVASGIPAPIDLNNAKIAGFARGTVNIVEGTISAQMG